MDKQTMLIIEQMVSYHNNENKEKKITKAPQKISLHLLKHDQQTDGQKV